MPPRRRSRRIEYRWRLEGFGPRFSPGPLRLRNDLPHASPRQTAAAVWILGAKTDWRPIVKRANIRPTLKRLPVLADRPDKRERPRWQIRVLTSFWSKTRLRMLVWS